MTMSRKNNKKKQFRVIKHNHTWVPIILFTILLGVTVAGVVFALEMAMDYSIDSKITAEHEYVVFLSEIYEKGKASGEDAKGILALSGRDFFVLDEKGNVILSQGESTYTSRKGELQVSPGQENLAIYFDQNDSWLKLDQENVATPDAYTMIINCGVKMIDIVNEREEELDEKPLLEQIEGETDDQYLDRYLQYARENNIKYAIFPVWFSVPLSDGGEVFVGKGNVYFNFSDINTILSITGGIILVLLILLILIIVNVAVTAHRQKKVVDTFLTDPLTKGHNWTWFTIRLEPKLRNLHYAKKNITVIEIVFINFRNFCTCHSLEEGEKMLCSIHDVIRKKLSKYEACAHVGTASFAVLLEYETEEELRKRLRNLIEELENIDVTHKFAFHVGADLVEVKKNAKGKTKRRTGFSIEKSYNNACMARATLSDVEDSRIAFFDQKLVDEKRWIDAVSERQSKAVENEEFVVYYQPKYDPRTNKLRGCEALIRWNSPDLGFVSPGKFIPIFEKNGFISEIDHYMIRHVARDQKAWLDQGLSCVPVSVNISRAHFIESDLAEQIRDMVDQEGTPRNLIEIELTESAFFDDKHAMIQTIQKLKEYGFMVSMDDFGAGYSSLNSLKDMPLDVLKLDADFFRGETEGGRGEIVVSEAIRLAKNLNMNTVAEGVEEKAQVEFLAKHGCDMIQGYYFAKPMTKEDYLVRLKSGISERAWENQSPEETPATEKAENLTDAENAPVAEAAQEVKDAMEAEAVQKVKEVLETEGVQEVKEVLETEGIQEVKEVLEAEDILETEGVQEVKEALEAEEIQDVKESFETEEIRETEEDKSGDDVSEG